MVLLSLRITLATALGIASLAVNAQQPVPNIVVQWNDAALQGIRDSKLGPPMVSRALAIVHTCMYDAWAAYDDRALGTRLDNALRRPRNERTLANKNQAIHGFDYQVGKEYLVYASQEEARDYRLDDFFWFGWTDVLPVGTLMLQPMACKPGGDTSSRQVRNALRDLGSADNRHVTLRPTIKTSVTF